jgi:PAS domain S-box-containing protein
MAKVPPKSADELAAELEEARRRIAALEAASADPAFSDLTDSMLDGFSLLSPDGIHLGVNPALCEMTGFTRDELIGVGPPHPYWPPEEEVAIEAALTQTLTGGPEAFALTFRRKNDERFPVVISPSVLRDASGEVVLVYATVKDMSALRRAEAALADSEQLFRLTFEQAPIGAALVASDFRFQRVNRYFSQMTGYSIDELLERGFADITHPDDVDADVAAVKRLIAGESEEYARVKRYVRKDGSIAWGDVVVRPVLDAAGATMACAWRS